MKTHATRRPVVAALPGFDHIERVWDAHQSIWLARIHPGDICVTASAEGVTTVLGSCVSACLRDTRTGIGGMNHFMLPPESDGGADRVGPGSDAMADLVNAVLAHGCGDRSRLELKLVGGAGVTTAAQAVARRAVEFVRTFVASAQLAIAAEDVGGPLGREVIYWPGTGQLRIRKLRGLQALLAEREREYAAALQARRAVGGRVG